MMWERRWTLGSVRSRRSNKINLPPFTLCSHAWVGAVHLQPVVSTVDGGVGSRNVAPVVWTPESVWTLFRREKSLATYGIRTPDRPIRSLYRVFHTINLMCTHRGYPQTRRWGFCEVGWLERRQEVSECVSLCVRVCVGNSPLRIETWVKFLWLCVVWVTFCLVRRSVGTEYRSAL
jgi:hypothetical protein